MGKHDHKKTQVEEMLEQGYSIVKIGEELNIPLGSMGYVLAQWGLLDKQVKRTRNFSDEAKAVWSKNYRDMLRAGKTSGKNHWSHGKLKFKNRWVPQEDVRAILEELVAQDMILAQMAEECQVDPKTVTNWLRRFGLQQGIRKGSRCSWYKGGYRKGRGPDWLQVREQILERDGYKCQRCGMTQEQARERGHTLSVHHIVPWRETHDNSPSNLVALCQSCHMKAEWDNGCWAED